MPRRGTIAADIRDYLSDRPEGAPISEIEEALLEVRRSAVLRPSVRSAIYQHLGDDGDGLFERTQRGHYRLRR